VVAWAGVAMVADDGIFEPDEWEIKVRDADRIGLRFRSDSGKFQEIVLPRSMVPGLIARLVAEIGPGQGVPIAGSLRPGQTILVQGFGGRRLPDGSAVLTLFVHLPDENRDVTIPLELSATNVVELVAILAGNHVDDR
jgi:hypothetical protein